MQFFNTLILVVVVCSGRAEVQLKQGKNSTVTFKGDELIIKIDNPQSKIEQLELCFGSRPDTIDKFCPQGFGYVLVNIHERTETLKLNRDGKLAGMAGNYLVGKNAVFNSDGSINVLVNKVPSGVTVSLPNANLPVITTTAASQVKKEATDKAVIGIVCGGILLLIILIIVGGVLFYCLWYKKRSHKPVPVTVPDDEVHRIDEIHEPLLPEIVVEPRAPPPPKRPVAPSATTTTTTRRTSTSATPSDEKPQVVAAPKPAPVPSIPVVIVMPSDAVSLTSASTQMESPCVTPKRKSRKSKSKASKKSKKSRRRASRTPVKTAIEKPGSPSLPVDKTQSPTMPSTQATPEYPDDPLTNAQAASSHYKKRDYLKRSETAVEKPGSPSLPVDKTQSPTMPSTQATPEYPDDPLTNAQAASSHYKKRDYLKRSEAPVPGSSRSHSRSRTRSRPIVDEVQDCGSRKRSRPCRHRRRPGRQSHGPILVWSPDWHDREAGALEPHQCPPDAGI
uniref:Uncharacterized protein n=1 Tax=Panagrellus redivivus TaxID=6233 RepID=A0A7E4VN71_PANRE